jgi:hypothetical protein
VIEILQRGEGHKPLFEGFIRADEATGQPDSP